MLLWRVVTILLLFSSLGSLVPVPGKHFLIETEDEAADEPDVEMKNKVFICTGSSTCQQNRTDGGDQFECLSGANCQRLGSGGKCLSSPLILLYLLCFYHECCHTFSHDSISLKYLFRTINLSLCAGNDQNFICAGNICDDQYQHVPWG